MSSTKIRGRFLPSRVFNRWKWTVRFGLMLVPFILLLSGGLTLFLAPNKYSSTTLFSLENGPPPQEIVELLESLNTLERVVDRLELVNRMEVDKETAMRIVRGTTKGKIVPNTRLIEITVTALNKVDARDIAEQIPVSLRDVLVETSRTKDKEKATEMDDLIREASDAAAENAITVANLEKVHGTNPSDAPVIATLQRARRASLLADAEVERLRILRSEFLTGNIDALPRLTVHSAPVISNSSSEPKADEELEKLVILPLVSGLITALLLPYLMELAFPPRRSRIFKPDPVDTL